jgi:hypothetical protein
MADNTLPESIREAYADAEHLADIISHGPDLLSDDILRWATNAVHAEARYPWQSGPPAPVAVTLPAWAADELTDLLSEGVS